MRVELLGVVAAGLAGRAVRPAPRSSGARFHFTLQASRITRGFGQLLGALNTSFRNRFDRSRQRRGGRRCDDWHDAPEALAHTCNLGVWHGISAHDLAESSLMLDPLGQSYPLQLAHAMGGEAPVACADLGQAPGKHKPFGATTLSKLTDAGAVLTALGAAPAWRFSKRGEPVPSERLNCQALPSRSSRANASNAAGASHIAIGGVISHRTNESRHRSARATPSRERPARPHRRCRSA